MSEQSPTYLSPSRGEEAPAEACRVCGSPHAYPGNTTLGYGLQRCIAHMRGEIGTLQGEVLALRQELAARLELPAPLCASHHHGWGLCMRRQGHPAPHANDVSGGRWVDPPAPEPQTTAEAAIADAAQWGPLPQPGEEP